MSEFHVAHWESTVSGVPRSERRSGDYRWYEPDRLVGHALVVDSALARRIADVERRIRALDGTGADVLSSVSRFLLRSEAIASSRIEGVAPSAKSVALAELGQTEEIRGLSREARIVADNLTVVARAADQLAHSETVTTQDLVDLHRALLADEPHLHGIRRRQNWVGGAAHHPLDADFVPPAPEMVPELVDDLLDYLTGAADSPLVQAALVHAQFETIHPFGDGNGRVGRALIHTALARRGLTTTAVLPISLVLATHRDGYIRGLDRFRHLGAHDSDDALTARRQWVSFFVDAAGDAAAQSARIIDEIRAVQESWFDDLVQHRVAQGLARAPRSDSATVRILGLLTSAPVLTVRTVTRLLGVSDTAASSALDELAAAGILATRRIGGRTRAFLANDLLDLLTVAERRLASTRFDTRESPPTRPFPRRRIADPGHRTLGGLMPPGAPPATARR